MNNLNTWRKEGNFDMSLVFDDYEIVEHIVNQGIDSRLEGFTNSFFDWEIVSGIQRLECKIHSSEMQILIRRLLEDGGEDAEMLADDIVRIHYDCELMDD
jgi:hypothetical protein